MNQNSVRQAHPDIALPQLRPEIKEIWDYKRQLQAFLIRFEQTGQQDMVKKVKAADSLLDARLKELFAEKQ